MYTGTVASSHQQTQTIQFASYKYAVRRIVGTKRMHLIMTNLEH